ncbi:MAG: dihydrolipoyl dehydrogenase [Chlorobi bacterium]|nr:dihydrolipoyl dehydrogenase [Chlorobiota bacterium]
MNYDIIIIGSGPGGYVAAIRASQLGMKVAVVEKAEIGGVCLNWGCIPTKSLLKSAQVYDYIKHSENYGIKVGEYKADFSEIIARSRAIAEQMSKGVQYLFKKNKITGLQGFGKLAGENTVEVIDNEGKTEKYTAKHIILATGSRSKELPNLKQDGKKIIGYREALTLEKQPESMIVAGSGAIGTELAFFYNSIGTQVTLIEFLPNVLPLEDEDVSKQIGRSLKKAKIKVMVSSAVEKVEIIDEKCVATVHSKGKEIKVEAEIVLSAVGVVPNLEHIGLEETGIELEKDKIKVDDFYRTNVKNIYAIGDIVHGQALAHVASAEGITCVEKIAGLNPAPVDYGKVPGAVYTTPEVASVGLTEKQAVEAGYEVKVGKFPYTASGKATVAGNRDGFIKLVFDAKSDKLLGAHFVGLNVTEMIAEAVVSLKLGAKGHDLIKSIHPHPTMSEAIMEAAAAAYDEVIHI